MLRIFVPKASKTMPLSEWHDHMARLLAYGALLMAIVYIASQATIAPVVGGLWGLLAVSNVYRAGFYYTKETIRKAYGNTT